MGKSIRRKGIISVKYNKTGGVHICDFINKNGSKNIIPMCNKFEVGKEDKIKSRLGTQITCGSCKSVKESREYESRLLHPNVY